MSKKKYIFFITFVTTIACLIVIFHIPFSVLIIGSKKVFEMRGAFLLIITPLTIIIVSILATLVSQRITKIYKNANKNLSIENPSKKQEQSKDSNDTQL